MKALVKAKPEPGIRMQGVPAPAVGRNDVLIAVRKAGVAAPASASKIGASGRA